MVLVFWATVAGVGLLLAAELLLAVCDDVGVGFSRFCCPGATKSPSHPPKIFTTVTTNLLLPTILLFTKLTMLAMTLESPVVT